MGCTSRVFPFPISIQEREFTVHKAHMYEMVADLGGSSAPHPPHHRRAACSAVAEAGKAATTTASGGHFPGRDRKCHTVTELPKCCLPKRRDFSPRALQGKCRYWHMLYMEPPEKPKGISNRLFHQSTGTLHHQNFLMQISNFSPVAFLVGITEPGQQESKLYKSGLAGIHAPVTAA